MYVCVCVCIILFFYVLISCVPRNRCEYRVFFGHANFYIDLLIFIYIFILIIEVSFPRLLGILVRDKPIHAFTIKYPADDLFVTRYKLFAASHITGLCTMYVYVCIIYSGSRKKLRKRRKKIQFDATLI